MQSARKRYGLSEKSSLLQVPETYRSRCASPGCRGNACVNWLLCGPASPFGSYLSLLSMKSTQVGVASVAQVLVPA